MVEAPYMDFGVLVGNGAELVRFSLGAGGDEGLRAPSASLALGRLRAMSCTTVTRDQVLEARYVHRTGLHA